MRDLILSAWCIISIFIIIGLGCELNGSVREYPVVSGEIFQAGIFKDLYTCKKVEVK